MNFAEWLIMMSTYLAKIIKSSLVVLLTFLLLSMPLEKINGKAIFGKFMKNCSKILINVSSKH